MRSRQPWALVGRILLWLVIIIALLRLAADTVSGTNTPPAAAVKRSSAPAWPGPRENAFALDFTRAYLSGSSRTTAFVQTDLQSTIKPLSQKPAQVSAPVVAAAGTERLDDTHALLTVAAFMPDVTRYLTVPVARDEHDNLIVYALPSFVARPQHADVQPGLEESLPSDEQGDVTELLERFFQAYLAGDDADVADLTPVGVRIPALGDAYQLVALDSVTLAEEAHGNVRTVNAALTARQGDVTYALSYRVRVTREDRWYVTAVNDQKGEQ